MSLWNSQKYASCKDEWFLKTNSLSKEVDLTNKVKLALQSAGVFHLRCGSENRLNKEQLLKFSQTFGNAVNQSADGCLVFDVQDEGLKPSDKNFRGPSSNRKLTFHTDRCDIILFHCIHAADQGGLNLFIHAKTLYETLRLEAPELLQCLEGAFTYKRHNADPANPNITYKLPVFAHEKDQLFITLMTYLIEKADLDPDLPKLTSLQREALQAIQQIAQREELNLQVKLEPGDTLFLNNLQMLHSRTAFQDSEPKRLYYRIWLAPDWSPTLPQCFAELFGNTVAGSIRGGFRKAAN